MSRSVRSREASVLRWFVLHTLFIAALFTFLSAASIPTEATERQVLSNALASSRLLHEMPRSTRINIVIGLPLRNQDHLESLLAQISDPASPSYRHYLTPQEFAEEFGPTEQDYRELIAHVQEKGLIVSGTHSNRLLLDVSGAAQDIESLLHVKIMRYQHPVRGEFYAAQGEPWLDTEVKTLSISGLDNFELPHPMGLRKAALSETSPYTSGSGPRGYFIGKDFRAAYAPGVSLTGSGQVVGLVEFDGFYASDAAANFALAGVPAVPTQTVLIDGFNGAPGSDNIEVILDIMMASYMAPGLTKVVVYEGYYPDDILNRMATDNSAQQLSSSWGFGIDAATEQIFKQFIAQGQSFLQASGDDGAYNGGVMTPSDDPNVTVVGGTSLTTAGSGGAWQSETAWSGSGGGISTTYPIPSYQQGFSMAASGGSIKMRNIPDVALTADIQMYLIFNNGQTTAIGGTSAATPLWAGFIALANQQVTSNGKPRIGFLNPSLYAIGNGSNYALDFHDITTGSDGYLTVTGYDLVTGWGSPAGAHLIADLAGTSSAPSFVLASSVSALSVKPSGSGTATLTVTAKNGFSDSVSLAATGLPTGVTAAFSAATTTSTSTVTITVGASVAGGTYPLTITGTSGTLSSTAIINLTVIAPSFSLAASPASLTVPQTGSGSSALSVSGQNGFSGTVSFAVAGLPTGVTAAFSPTTATTSAASKVTFTVGAAVPAGTYSLTITGTSGTLSSKTSVALTVQVPSFSLTASPASLTVPQTGSGSSALSVSSQNGFKGTVSFAVAGLPTGVTAAFSPTTATTSAASKVTFTVGAAVPAGNYSLTITGTSGTLSSKTSVALTVQVRSFSLTASPANLTVPQTGSGSSALNVSGQNGFKGTVSFAVAGLPTGVTAAFSPTTATTSAASKVTFTVGAAVPAGTYSLTITGTSGTLSSKTSVALTVTAPNFTLSFQPATLTLPRGLTASGTLAITAVNGFKNTVTLTVSGLPSGVTASLGALSTTGTRPLTFTASSTATVGSYPITVTGVSGSLTSKVLCTVTITAPSAGIAPVNLASKYNINAFVADGLPFSGGGLDGGLNGSPTAYSATLIGTQQTIGGTTFYFGPANAPDAVSGQTIALPSGQFPSIALLATAVNGKQLSQVFKVTYTDGSVTSFTQNLSEWFTPQGFAGEKIAMTMPYRNNYLGQIDHRTFYLYEYVFTATSGKTVASITLPNNRNVVVLAATLTGATSAVR